MADPSQENVVRPFSAFNFKIEITISGESDVLCNASFSDCDGLEMTMEPKTIREGGNNNNPIHLLGPVNYGQLSLKRGMTDSFHLWEWFEKVLKKGQGGLRANAEVIIMAADGITERARFQLTRCIPIKLKAPVLNAKDGNVAVEEMQIAYEMLSLVKP